MAGGSLVTATSNGANQIWERDLDKLMNRTSNRPIPSGHLSVQTAVVIVVLLFISGTTLLWMINLKSALLGVSAFLSYVFLYTPLKTRTPWAVLLGPFRSNSPHARGYCGNKCLWISSRHFILCPIHMAIPSFLGHRMGHT